MFTKLAKLLSPTLRQKEGFTLIELLIVVAIIAILAAIAIPQFSAYRRRGYNSAAISDLRNIRTTQEAMFADFQDYGSNAGSGPGGQMLLDGLHTSTVDQSIQLSTGVLAISIATATAGKNTTFLGKTTHTAGDQAYGGDSDASGTYRHACTTPGACAAGDRDVAPAAAVSGTDDFASQSIWVAM